MKYLKQMRRYLVVMLVIVAFSLVSVVSPAHAETLSATDQAAAASDTDTLALTQASYSQVISSLSRLGSDSDKIQQTIETFLRMSKAKSRDFNDYDVGALLDAASITFPTINYYLKNLEYRYLIDKANNIETTKDDVLFSGFNVVINGDQAKASIVENYSYVIQGKFNMTCSRTKEYTFGLQSINNGWYISSITTNDPWEQDPSFSYSDFDVKAQVASAMSNTSSPSPNEAEGMKLVGEKNSLVTSSAPAYFWTYNRSAAANYAGRYYNGVNPLFGTASDDCQNFASQCIWAGLKESTNITVPPVVYDSTHPSSNPRLWQHNNSCTGAPYGSGWYWDNVNGFFYLINSSVVANGVGPYGWANFGNVDYADVGDLISYADQPVSAQNNWNLLGHMLHCMVVTKVTGTSGSRGLSDMFISAHNNPTSSAQEPLSQYAPGHPTETWWSTARITGGQYNVGQ